MRGTYLRLGAFKSVYWRLLMAVGSSDFEPASSARIVVRRAPVPDGMREPRAADCHRFFTPACLLILAGIFWSLLSAQSTTRSTTLSYKAHIGRRC